MNECGCDDEKVLLVDDEPRVLLALYRMLSTRFHIETADGGEHALQAMEARGPFAVVVSDLKMPGMDGIDFLARVKARSAETVRVMLTGQADLNGAMAAVNEGNIFRFLGKPCPALILSRTIQAALDQYRLITAERELLQRTLMGSVAVLTEILSAVHPAAFSRSFRIKRLVTLLAKAVGMQDIWHLEVAGLLSQIGCVALPPDASVLSGGGGEASEEERRLFTMHAVAGAGFLRRIPRLETVSEIILLQQKPYREYEEETEGVAGRIVATGGQILHIAVDLERLAGQGLSFRNAIARMRACAGDYNPEFLDALEEAGEPVLQWKAAVVRVSDLNTSMIVNQEVRTPNGLLLASKGEQLRSPVLARLRGLAALVGVAEPIQVLVAEEASEPMAAHVVAGLVPATSGAFS